MHQAILCDTQRDSAGWIALRIVEVYTSGELNPSLRGPKRTLEDAAEHFEQRRLVCESALATRGERGLARHRRPEREGGEDESSSRRAMKGVTTRRNRRSRAFHRLKSERGSMVQVKNGHHCALGSVSHALLELSRDRSPCR